MVLWELVQRWRKSLLRGLLNALLCVLVFVGFGYVQWLDVQHQRLQADMLLSGDQDKVLVATGSSILQLDLQGGFQAEHELRQLRLPAHIHDLLALGGDYFLVSLGHDAGIWLCTLTTLECHAWEQSEWQQLHTGSVQLARDSVQGRVVLVDRVLGKLWLADKHGEPLAKDKRWHLSRPGRVDIHGSSVLVADAGHQRVLGLALETGGFSQQGWELDVAAWQPVEDIPGGKRLSWTPVAVVSAFNRYWLLQQADAKEPRFALAVFDRDGQEQSIRLGDVKRPQALRRIGGQLLIFDADDFQWHRFTGLNTGGRIWGDKLVQQRLAEFKWQADQLYHRETGVRFALAGALICLFVWTFIQQIRDYLSRMRQRKARMQALQKNEGVTRQESTVEPVYADQDYVSVDQDTGLLWIASLQRRWSSNRVLLMVNVGMVSVLGGLFYEPMMQQGVSQLTYIFMILPLLFMAFYFWIDHGRDLSKARIGTDGRELWLVDHQGRTVVARSAQVQYSDHALVAGGVVVLVSGRGAFGDQNRLFPTQPLMEHVFPLLRAEQKISSLRVLIWMLRARHPTVWYPLESLAITLLLLGVIYTILRGF